MTVASLLLGTIISQILFILTKVFFMGSMNLESWVVVLIFYIALALETIAVVRRMGVLNYIESLFLVGVWVITTLIADFLITANWVGRDIYGSWQYWFTHVVIILALLIFHKKLHVEVRKASTK